MSIIVINYENGRIWHSDCTNHFGGIMKEVSYDTSNEVGIFECLHCGKKGKLPKGSVGKRTCEEVTG